MSALGCDRCCAAAKHKVIIHTGGTIGDIVFLFCQHHYNEHEAKLYELDNADITTLVA
jgi:hypothetical protein